MKALLSLVLLLSSSLAFAGTGVSWQNSALNFIMMSTPSNTNIVFCDHHKCLEFKEKSHVGDVTKYTELKGLCDITVTAFEKDFATGKTKNEYMLSLMAQVVEVTRGEDKCELEQTDIVQQRSLTGIYQ